MSPITMAILELIAYKALKSFSGNQPSAAGAGPGASTNPNTGATAPGGGLGDLLKGGLRYVRERERGGGNQTTLRGLPLLYAATNPCRGSGS
jgi:hypothetical protein